MLNYSRLTKGINRLKSDGEIYFGQPSDELVKVLAREFSEYRNLPAAFEEILYEARWTIYRENVTAEDIREYGEKTFRMASKLRHYGAFEEIKPLMRYLIACSQAGTIEICAEPRFLIRLRNFVNATVKFFNALTEERRIDPVRAACVVRHVPLLRRFEVVVGKKMNDADILDILEYFEKSKLSLVRTKKIVLCRMLGMPWEDAENTAKGFKTLKETIAWVLQVSSIT